MIVRPETAADFITGTAELVRETAGLAEEAIRLVREALANPAPEGLRHALAVLGAGLHEAAAAVRAQEPSVAMFAAVEEARHDQCAACPLLRARVVTLPVQRRQRGGRG